MQTEAEILASNRQLPEVVASKLLLELKSTLAFHDWYYSRSDDYSVYSRGQQKAATISELRTRLEKLGFAKEATELYEAYVSNQTKKGN
jgi:hypothetical protein